MNGQPTTGQMFREFGRCGDYPDARVVAADADSVADETIDQGPRPRWTLSHAGFCLACGGTGFVAALILAVVLFENIAEPVGLLLAVAGLAWALISVALYQLAARSARDRAIVMGGGVVSAVMCSMMFLE